MTLPAEPFAQSFGYDDLYRLTSATGSFEYQPGKVDQFSLTLSYDGIHNIRTKSQIHEVVQPATTEPAIPQRKTSYAWIYDYTGAQPHAPSHIGQRAFLYDVNGNQAGWDHDQNGTNRRIAWDEENRVQTVTDTGHETTYKYGDQGDRVIKRGPQGETVYVNQFFTIRNREVGTKHIFTGASRAVSKLMVQDKPGANPQGKQPREKDLYFYHPDHLGSTSYVTDTEGKLYQHLQYFPFGETWVEQATNTQRTPYRFTGKELDEETGLYYFGARYFDPRTSVWQSVDPALGEYLPKNGKPVSLTMPVLENNWRTQFDLKGMGGVFESKNLSLYSYSLNNPVIFVDPDGRVAWFVWIARLLRIVPKKPPTPRPGPGHNQPPPGLPVPPIFLPRPDLPEPDAPQAEIFPNQLPEFLDTEMGAAGQLGVNPITPADPGFESMVNAGDVKFVVTQSGELLLTPHTVGGTEISHAVLSGGEPVLAAGEANIAAAGGQTVGINITNQSGHFRPSLESLKIAREAFARYGIEFPLK